MSKKSRLRKKRNEKCRKCNLYKSTVNRCVMGRGDTNSPIMLIGEAPGQAESETGKPFMGRAGRLLNEILVYIGIDPYITNFCKCRPPENRTPEFKELRRCFTYLESEIKIIKPRVILIMGKTVAKKAKFSKQRLTGKPFSWYDSIARITVHPAYVLRNRTKKPILVEALEWAKREATK